MRKGFWLWLAVVVTAVGSVAYAAALPMDFSPAPAAAEQNYLSDHEYRDDTLHVLIEEQTMDDSVYHIAHVEITDPSQLRTALSCDPGQNSKAPASTMANANNAVIAINGDSYLYRTSGYIMRQGQVLRKSFSTKLDLLLIDDAGDFHALRKPTRAGFTDLLKNFQITQCLAFGPVLVMDGELQPIRVNYGFSAQDRSPRTAIGQVGPLSYVLVVADGRQSQSRGVTHQQMGKMMASLGCTAAFNLDGGGSSTMVFHGKVYNSVSEGAERNISDIIYFASGLGG